MIAATIHLTRICPARVPFLALLAAIACGSALAQDRTGQGPAERFSLQPTPNGFLKIDGQIGVVSECRREGTVYQCRLVPDEREAMQAEIDRLSRENEALREAQATKGGSRPSSPDQEVDRAIGMMETLLRWFMAILREESPRQEQPL